MTKLPVQLLYTFGEPRIPTRAHETDAGLDLYSPVTIDVLPMRVTPIDIEIAIALPPHTVGLILGRSGLSQSGLFPIGGVIDEGYRGPLRVTLANFSDMLYTVHQGDRIAQLVIFPIVTPEPEQMELGVDTQRGTAGFSSTGT